jgi:membrane protein YqaA with SNARE-associated domain
MKGIVDWIQAVALALGAPGLFVVAFLDSSFLSLPEINDLLLIWMVTRHKSRMVLYASAATLGSIAGCLVLYYLGRKGGDALVRRRFTGARVDWALATMQRYGVMAVLIPSLLPPPAPFKIFVILAGASRMSPWTFAVAVVLGRGFRYFGEGLLAVWYGERALRFLEVHGRQIALYVGVAVLAAGLLYFWIRSRRTPAALPPAQGTS